MKLSSRNECRLLPSYPEAEGDRKLQPVAVAVSCEPPVFDTGYPKGLSAGVEDCSVRLIGKRHIPSPRAALRKVQSFYQLAIAFPEIPKHLVVFAVILRTIFSFAVLKMRRVGDLTRAS